MPGDEEIELTCKNCGRKTTKSLSWVQDNNEVICDCGTLIPVDATKFNKEVSKAESTADGAQGLMEKLGR